MSTIIWRFRILVKRDKGSVLKAILFPIVFIALAIILGTTHKTTYNEMQAVTDTIVTSSEYDGAASTFQLDPDTFSTTQNFAQCLTNRARQIGLIKDGSGESNAVLNSVFKEINDAFIVYNTKVHGDDTGLLQKDFTSQEEATDYIGMHGYSKNALCFTLRWDQYDN